MENETRGSWLKYLIGGAIGFVAGGITVWFLSRKETSEGISSLLGIDRGEARQMVRNITSRFGREEPKEGQVEEDLFSGGADLEPESDVFKSSSKLWENEADRDREAQEEEEA